jgi:hypothetical protein
LHLVYRENNGWFNYKWGRAVVQLVKATSWKVAGSIPDGALGNFH